MPHSWRRQRLTFVDEAIEGAESGAVGGDLVGVKSHQQPRSRRVVLDVSVDVATQLIVPLVTLVHRRRLEVQVQTHVVHTPARVTAPLVGYGRFKY